MTSISPAPNSEPAAVAASGRAGVSRNISISATVPRRPSPPNHPSSFCPPWPMKTAPMSRRSSVRTMVMSLAPIPLG